MLAALSSYLHLYINKNMEPQIDKDGGDLAVTIPSQTPNASPSRSANKKTSRKYWTIQLYNSGEALEALNGIALAQCNPTSDASHVRKPSPTPEKENNSNQEQPPIAVIPDRMACSTCVVEFQSRLDQRDHFKSDWHRYNLHQQLKGHNSVTVEEFEEISGCVSSISGSESDSESENEATPSSGKLQPKPRGIYKRVLDADNASSSCDSDSDAGTIMEEAARKYPKVFFRNSDGNLLSVYRCVMHHKSNPPKTYAELVSMVTGLHSGMNWAVIMASGGHFAAAIFDREKMLLHKTFHRYVVRAKRGTAQSSRDNQGNAPKSAGSSLRRYNEEALKEDITTLIKTWSAQMSSCDLIFLRAPGFNKKMFFSGKNPVLMKNDKRIRMIPFPTKRPTLNEVRRVHQMLASIECYGAESELQGHMPVSPPVTYNPDLGCLEVIKKDEQPASPQRKSSTKTRVSPLAGGDQRKEQTGEEKEIVKDTVQKGQQLHLLERVLQTESLTTSSGASTGSESELVECMESLSTSDLKKFTATKKPKRKKKQNRKRHPSKHQSEPEDDSFAEEKYHLKNLLYTACKTGNSEEVRNLLAVFMVVQTTGEKGEVAPQDEEKDNKSSDKDKVDDNSETVTLSSESFTNKCDTSDVKHSDDHDVIEDHVTSNQDVLLECNTDNVSSSEFKPDMCSESHDSSQQVPNTKSCVEKPLSVNVVKGQSPRPVNSGQDVASPVVTSDILNEPIGDNGITLLHVAAKEGHHKVIKNLLENGADPTVKDKYGQPPYTATSDKETRNEFRRFMARYPDKYDYKITQIPGPLTPEMELERKQREAERKKVQKKAKQQKLKEKKAVEEVKEAEEKEKQRFLALSDREKRALAAERRLLQQADTESVVLRRCYQCGADISGKVPFEYFDFKFCTPKCLQQHRAKKV